MSEVVSRLTAAELSGRMKDSPLSHSPLVRAMGMLEAVARAAHKMGADGRELSAVDVYHVFDPSLLKDAFEVRLRCKLRLRVTVREDRKEPVVEDVAMDALKLAHAILAKVPTLALCKAIKQAGRKMSDDEQCPMEWIERVVKEGGR